MLRYLITMTNNTKWDALCKYLVERRSTVQNLKFFNHFTGFLKKKKTLGIAYFP